MEEEKTGGTLGDLREQFRLQRSEEFLATALKLVTSEGVPALTMQRIADELGCSVGLIYRYFPSKNALLGELQRGSLDVLHTSLQLTIAHLDELLLEKEASDSVSALARVVCAAHFWIGAEKTYPQEVEISRLLFTDPSVHFSEEDGARVLPAAFRVLAAASRLFDAAAGAGALEAGVSIDRAMIVIAGTTGVLLTSGLARWDENLLDGSRLAATMTRALFTGWGADRTELDAVEDVLRELAARGHLAPLTA